MFDDCGEDIDGPVGEFGVPLLSHEVVSSGSAFSIHFGEIGGVSVERKNHVAGLVSYGSIWMGDEVIEKVMACCLDHLSDFGLA